MTGKGYPMHPHIPADTLAHYAMHAKRLRKKYQHDEVCLLLMTVTLHTFYVSCGKLYCDGIVVCDLP